MNTILPSLPPVVPLTLTPIEAQRKLHLQLKTRRVKVRRLKNGLCLLFLANHDGKLKFGGPLWILLAQAYSCEALIAVVAEGRTYPRAQKLLEQHLERKALRAAEKAAWLAELGAFLAELEASQESAERAREAHQCKVEAARRREHARLTRAVQEAKRRLPKMVRRALGELAHRLAHSEAA